MERKGVAEAPNNPVDADVATPRLWQFLGQFLIIPVITDCGNLERMKRKDGGWTSISECNRAVRDKVYSSIKACILHMRTLYNEDKETRTFIR